MQHLFPGKPFPAIRNRSTILSVNPHSPPCASFPTMDINIQELLRKLEVDDGDARILGEAETVSAADGEIFSSQNLIYLSKIFEFVTVF